MTTPPPGEPGRNLDAEALSRVLDGLALDPDADATERDAHVRAEDDVAALRRALLLIGDAFAEPAAAGTAPMPADSGDDAKGAVVLPFAARLRAKAPILAAAASIVAVIGLGAVLVDTGGSDKDSSATAQQPADAPAAAAPEAYAGQNLRASAGAADTAASGTQAAPAAEAAPAAAAGAPKAAKTANKGAPAKDEQSTQIPPAVPKSSTESKRVASALDAAVTCSRAIFVGSVVLVVPSGDGYQLTVRISEPIANSRSELQTYRVGKNYARTPDGQQDLTVGREFLFVIPQSTTKAVYAIPNPNAEDRKQVAEARDRAKGAGC